MCFLLGPEIADRLADAYSDIVGYASDELAVYDLMSVSSRHHAAASFAAYRQQGQTPDYEVSVAHVDEQLRRALKRLGC